MKRYAVLDVNNVVSNIIIAKSLEIAEDVSYSTCIEITQSNSSVQIGSSYADGVFSEPETPTE